jgi:ketosteroid isomerase-like protein
MSEENVQIVRQVLEAHLRRDNEMTLDFYDPDIEVRGLVDPHRVYRGRDGVAHYFRDWIAPWASISGEVDEWIDAGDQVIAIVHERGRGKLSGVEVEQRNAHLWTLRDGRLFRLRIFASKAEALEAVGVSE